MGVQQILTRWPHKVLLIGLLGCVTPRALSQKSVRDEEQPPECDLYQNIQEPYGDLPTAEDWRDLRSCNSENLYFGFGQAADPVRARKCAYIERAAGNNVPDTVFGGSGLLAMIYANGKGAARNLDVALKFSCETGWAKGEKDARFGHLLKLKSEHWTGDDFSLCDDATSGFMDGQCAQLQARFDEIVRDRKLSSLTRLWNSQEQRAFGELEQAAKAFFEASSRNEVDLSGSGRAAFEIEAEAKLNDEFLTSLQQFAAGKLPNFSSAEVRQADTELNSIYWKIQANGPDPNRMGTVTPDGIKIAERAWLRYREAWVHFGRVKYPSVTADSWRTWLTQQRIDMIKGFISE